MPQKRKHHQQVHSLLYSSTWCLSSRAHLGEHLWQRTRAVVRQTIFTLANLGFFPDSHSENLKVYCHKANKEMKQTSSPLPPGCCTGIAQGANCGQICQHIQCFMCTHLLSCRRKVHLPLLLPVYQLCVR